MVSSRRTLDEDDVRIRPGRGKSRARTKDRPQYADAVPGTVTAVDRGRFTVLLDSPQTSPVYAVKSRELGRKGVVVGDRVGLIGSSINTLDSPMRIVSRQVRDTVLRRTADDADPVERVIVANATRMAIVTSTTDPEPRPGLIDRSLVAAWEAGIEPFLIITKIDLSSPQPLRELYDPLGITIIESDASRIPAGLRDHLHDQVTVVLGHSGVGKSTLVNQVIPESTRETGHVNDVTGRGRHTSTSVEAFAVPGGGVLIDTPGIRSFGLAHVDVDKVLQAFNDLLPLAESCPRSCDHSNSDCALVEYARTHPDSSTSARITSFQRLITSMSGAD